MAGLTVASAYDQHGKQCGGRHYRRRTGKLFELKVGEVSPVITDSAGHYIYKLEAKDRLALDQVKDEIRQTLESQRAKEALEKIQNSYRTELNQQYFAAPVGK